MAIIFKPILPKKFLDKVLVDTLAVGVDSYKPFLQKDFDSTTMYWKEAKPSFVIRFNKSYSVMSLSVIVGGSEEGKNKWWWLNDGTPAHVITPRNAQFLRFPEGAYRSGSKPNTIKTSPSTFRPTGRMIYAKSVNHPGTKARNWLSTIAKMHKKPFKAWMTNSMSNAARASGHKI